MVASNIVKMSSLPLKLSLASAKATKIEKNVPPTVEKTATTSVFVKYLVNVIPPCCAEEYKNVDFTGKQYCIDNGIELHFHLRRHQYSSTELRNRVYELEKAKREEKGVKEIQQYAPELLEKYNQK